MIRHDLVGAAELKVAEELPQTKRRAREGGKRVFQRQLVQPMP